MTVFTPLFWLRAIGYIHRARQQRLSYEAQTGKGKTRVKTSRMSGAARGSVGRHLNAPPSTRRHA